MMMMMMMIIIIINLIYIARFYTNGILTALYIVTDSRPGSTDSRLTSVNTDSRAPGVSH